MERLIHPTLNGTLRNITRLDTGGAGPYRTLSLALPAALLPIVTQQTPADTKKVIDSSAPK